MLASKKTPKKNWAMNEVVSFLKYAGIVLVVVLLIPIVARIAIGKRRQ